MTPHVENKKDVRGTITLLIFVIVVVGFIGWLVKDHPEGKNKQTTTQTTPAPKKLGSEWKKIEMVQGEWYGPFSIRGGSTWNVVEGEIICQIDNHPPYQDGPNLSIHKKSGKSVKFKVAEGYSKATIYFKY